MTRIVKALKLQMSTERIRAMMADADPDGSGEVDFEEFVAALKTQMAKGGQLADVVTGVGGMFGFLNPINWFSSAPSPPPATPPEPPKPKVDENALRAQLRPLFDKFDADGSGSISTAEMTSILGAIEMEMSEEAIAQMMADADPDGSGEVDFEEFVTVLRIQMQGGGGGLASALKPKQLLRIPVAKLSPEQIETKMREYYKL